MQAAADSQALRQEQASARQRAITANLATAAANTVLQVEYNSNANVELHPHVSCCGRQH